MRRIRRHLTFANVASAIALFVAVSGGTAVALSGSNTVQSDDLGPGAQVQAPDVAANAVNGTKIVNNSVGTVDLAPAARGARAYGHVLSGGGLTTSKGIASVGHTPGSGIYCITLAGTISNAVLVVGPDWATNGTGTASESVSDVEWDSSGASCAAGRLAVRTFIAFGDPADDNAGGDDLQVRDQPFSFVVP